MKENEFNLNSATRYEDGEPITSDMPVQLIRLAKRVAFLEKKVGNEEIGQYTARSLKEYFDDALDDEMKAIADEYIKHEERILKLERLCNQLHDMITELDKDLSREFREFKKFVLYPCVPAQKSEHIGSNFCGNCAHCDHGKQGDDTVYVCSLSAEIVDPDESSCSMFEHPF